MKPNGQPVTVVNAYLDFNPQFLQIDSIDTGDGTFEVVDLNNFDNVTGTADFSSRTNGPGVAEDFVLATITFIPTAPVGRTAIDFSTVFPRETTATFLGAAVVDSLSGLELLRLAQAETFLVEPGVLGPVVFEIGGDTEVDLSVSLVAVVRNLVRLTADNDNTPTFQWDLPAVPPQAGILTFEVATGDLGGPAFVDEDFRVFTGDAFEFTCFFEAVDVGCGDPNVIDTVQLTLISPLADGDYRLGVRIVDGDGIPGPVVQLPFTITLILIFPVTPPVLTAPIGGVFINDSTPLFDWEEPAQGNPIRYILRATSGDIENGPFDVAKVRAHPTTRFQVQPGDALPDGGYVWRVVVSGDINTASSITENFFLDTTPPTQPGIPERFITGDLGDNTSGRFEWAPSEDLPAPTASSGDASGVDFYAVEIRLVSNNALIVQGVVQPETCDAVCTFVVPPGSIVLPGEYRITVEPQDNVGNLGDASELVFREGRLDVIQDLHLVDPTVNIDGVDAANIRNPQFQWAPPPEPPDTGDLERGGIVTYEVAITGDFVLPFTPYDDSDFFLAECFDATGDSIGQGDICTTAIDPNDSIRITVLTDLTDGTYEIEVRIITAGNAAGVPVPLPFIVDATAPLAPVSVAPEDQAILRFGEGEARSIDFRWDSSPSNDVVRYLLQITSGDIQTGPYDVERVISDPEATGDTVIMPIRGVFQWRVVAQDAVLNTGSSEARTFTVIDRIVDLRLVPDRDIMRHDTEFKVTIQVEPNGQPVDDVAAFLNFNPGDLEVLGIAPGNGALDLVLESAFDNQAGTVDFSAITIGDPPDGTFDLAQVFFRALGHQELVKNPAITFNCFSVDGVADDTCIASGDRVPDAAFKSVTVVDEAIGTVVTVLQPTVDLVLENQEFTSPGFEGFVRGQRIDVPVLVETNGQSVDTVFAALHFDARDLEVVNIGVGDGTLDQVLINSFDNDRGEVLFSSFTGAVAPSNDFLLTVVRFRTKRATRSLSVGFRDDSDAAFSSASVLRDLRGFLAEMSLQLRLKSFPDAPLGPLAISGFAADVIVTVRPNGNRIDTVASFIDFTPGLVEVSGITRGRRLETVLLSTFNNILGVLDYTALTVGPAPIGEFNLAVVDSILIGDLDSLADAQVLFVGETGAAFDSEPVPLILTPLLSLRPDAPGPLQNLIKTTPNNDTTPVFQWNPPLRRPAAGISTFRMTITGSGDTPDPDGLQGRSVLDIGDVRCRDVFGGPTPCLGDSGFNLDQVEIIRFTLAPGSAVADGSYRLTLVAVDNLGVAGEETVLQGDLIIDTTSPGLFDLVTPPDGAFINTQSPFLIWTVALDELSDVFYDVELDDNRDFSSPEAFTQVATTAWTVARPDGSPLEPSLEYFWRVRAKDNAGEQSGILALGEVAQAQQELVQGNTGLFTEPFSFTIDIVPPGSPTDLRSISIGGNTTNDDTPTFQWVRSDDDFGVDRYDVVITRINTGDIVGQVLDDECDDITGLCTFTVSDSDALTDDQNGVHTITVTVVDQANNSNNANAAFTFDNRQPTAPIIDPETFIDPARTESSPDGVSIVIRWLRATDPGFPNTGSGVDFYRVAIDPINVTGTADDSDDQAVCPNGLCEFRTPPLTDGEYTFRINAADAATNEGEEATRVEFIGNAALAGNLNQLLPFAEPPAFSWRGPRTGDVLSYDVGITGDNDSAQPSVLIDFEDFRNPAFFNNITCDGAECTDSIDAGQTVQVSVQGLGLPEGRIPDGTHRIGIKVVNLQGIRGPAVAITFQVDTTAPVPAADLQVDATSRVTGDDRTPVFTWQASGGDVITGDLTSGDVSGLDHYRITISGDKSGTFKEFFTEGLETDFTLPIEESLPDDQYLASVEAVDLAGNRSAPATAEFFVDLLAPPVPANLVRGEPNPTEARSLGVGWDPSLDAGIGLDYYQFHIGSIDLADVTRPPAPVLISPADGGYVQSGDTITFEWEQVQDNSAVVYVLVLATDDISAPFFVTGDIPGVPGIVQFTLDTILAEDDYRYAVQAVDQGRNVSPLSEVNSFSVVSDDTPPPIPARIAPVGEINGDEVLEIVVDDTTPTFIWQRVDDEPIEGRFILGTGVTYHLQADPNPAFSGAELAIDVDGITDTSFTPTDALTRGIRYFWRVQAVDGVGNPSGFTGDASVRISAQDGIAPAAPELVFPPSPSTSGNPTPTFIWSQVEDDSDVNYTIQIALTGDEGAGAGAQATVIIVQQEDVLFRFAPSARTADLNTVVPLDVRISSLGPSIDGARVSIDIVAPLTFFDISSGDVDTFIVTADGGVDFVATFAETTGDVRLATLRVQTPADRVEMAVPNVVYVNTGDRKTVGTTGDQEIEATLENGTVTLTELEVEFDPFVDSLVFTATTEDTQITLGTADVPATGDFLWRVFAVDAGGNTGDISEVSQFTRVLPDDAPEPGVPALTSPDDGARITTDLPAFTWTEVIDGSGVTYDLQVSTTGDFSIVDSLVIDVTGLAAASFTPSESIPDGDYYWQVRTVNGAGKASSFSDTRTLSLDATAPAAPTTIDVETFVPELGRSTATYTPTFSWSRVTRDTNGQTDEVVRYEVVLDPNTPEAQSAVITGDTTTFTPDIPIAFGAHHFFQIRPVDDFENAGIAALFFFDAITGDEFTQSPTFTLGVEDFLPAGAHRIEVRAVDQLAAQVTGDADRFQHQSDGAELLCRASETVVCERVAFFDPASQTVPQNQAASLEVHIDPLGVEIDGAAISINIPSSLSFDPNSGITFGDVRPPTILNSADGQFDFEVTFDVTSGDKTLATLTFATPTAGTVTVAFVNSGDRKTVARFLGEDLDLTRTDATITVQAPSGGGGVIIPPAPAGDPPIADAGADLEVSEGDTATLDASASFHPDGEEATALLTFLWEQLSGPPVELTAADTATPSFVTVDDAVYTFQVTVTDPELPDDPATDEVQVSVINVAPDVNAGPNQTQILGNAVTISPSFTDVGVEDTHSATVAWGDGTVDNIDPAVSPFSAEHAYEDNGTFTVTVTVTDDDGGAGADTVTVTIELPEPIPPTAVAGADQDADEGATLLFEGGGSLDPDGQILLYEWDFGDGLTAVGVTQTNVYDDDGVFTVTLTVTDDQGLSATDTMVVTVNNVAPRVEPGDTLRIDEGGTVTITPTFADLGVLDTHIALIDWGDDTEETLVDPATSPMSVEHVYSDNDTFTVTITVTDDDEGVTVETLDIIVANLDPEVEAGEDVIGFVGESVAIQPSFTDAGLDDTHSATVDWGDGTTGAVNPAISPLLLDHTYDATGQFIVTVTVTDDDGGTGTDTLQIVVISAVALTAGLEVSELTLSTESPSAGEPVSARFRVTNSSDVTLDATISVLVNGEEEIAIEITELRPGASRTLRTPRDQPIVRRDPGIYAIQVQDQVATFTILPAVIVVSNLTVSPRVAAPGNLIEILADVSNEGAAPGRFEVNISVDGDTFLREGRLLPDQVRTIRRAIPVTPNLVGITSPGLHNVRVEGEDDSYKIVRPVLSAPVPVNPPFNPATTAARDANGNSLGLVPGGAINFGRGSITFSLPLQVEQGVKVDSFVDVTSGINVIGTAVEVPVKDAIGVTLLTVRGELAAPLEGSGDAASGVFESVRILTEERTEDLSAADPNVGNMSVTIDAGLDQLPPDTNVDVTIKKQLSEEDRFGVELLAREGSKIVANEAGTVTVETTALTNDDVADVDIAIKVSRDWIFQFGATNVRIAHVGSDGTLELLIPVCTPDETFTEFTCVAHSDKGFSEFSLLALANEPADFVAENLVVSPNAVAPGESVKITVDIINEGAAPGAFSSILKLALGEGLFEPIAVKEITLLAGETGRVTFFVEREEQGEYSIEVEGRRGEFLRSTFEVSRALDPANLSLSDLIITPALVEPFNSVTIKLVATNQGEVDGRTELEFRINSVLTELRSLVIPGGSSIDVEFNFEPPAEGVFTVEITDPEERVQPVSGEIIAEIPLSPAILVFEEFGVTPLQAQPGEQVTVSFAITNFGETPDTFTAILLLNDEEIARQVDVSVDALASEPIVFTFDAPAETGQYTVVVEDTGLDGSFSVVGIANVLRIVSLDVSATQVLFGDDVTVSVVLENTTGQPLTQTLSLILDGTIFEDRTVTVAAGETTTETFDIVSPAEGSHSVEIAGVPAKSFDVRVTEVQPALLKLSPSIEISPREVEAGDTVTIRVTITNEGEEPGATTLILQVNGVEADRKSSGTIRGGQNVTVEFETAQEEGGDYNVLVQALEAEEGFDIGEDSFTVLAVPTDNLVLVRPVTVAPSSVVSGLPVTISVLVTNEGTVEGTLPVRLLIDGTLIDTQDVTLAGGGSITVEFADIVEPGVGVHQVSVNGLTSQFTVTAEAAAAAGGSPIIIIVIVVVVVLIAAGGGAFFFMKKKAA